MVVRGMGAVGRAILAPMSGVTDVGMREAAYRFGVGLAVSEMVASDHFVAGDEEARLRAERTSRGRYVVQLAGCQAHWMGEAARLAEAQGADLVDINMGCPAKRVTGGWAGSALMRDLDHATALIRAVVAATSRPVSVKMRLGWDVGSIVAPELARRAEAEGAALIVVHGRTRAQFYDGRADWSAVRAVRQATSLPLVVNGDCAGAGDARAMVEASGADAVMVGRACVGAPWLAGEIDAALRGAPAPARTPSDEAEAARG
ncbi:MAG: tRNA-dihydrouridine synthase family protein, partial [Hyphomicrobiales bacterium]|nr:tRNA-dihydrouridine synthase family protein [Hyphomicrobiales bacterium]